MSNGGDDAFRQQLERLNTYADSKLNKVFRSMLNDLFKATPDDPVDFMIDWLNDYKSQTARGERKRGKSKPHNGGSNSAGNSADDDESESNRELPVLQVQGPGKNREGAARRRPGVSAEPMDMNASSAPTRVIPKTDPDRQAIRDSVKTNFLFTSLDENQMTIVLDAMERKEYKVGQTIIAQGADGDDFYVLSDGECECFLNQPNGQPAKMVKLYRPGESFGELALMYNLVRQASVVAKTHVQTWAMDRGTFRKVLMNTTSQKRQRYETFLQNVPILTSLDRYERAKIADALVEKMFQDGEKIITAGDWTDTSFYILAEGECKATKKLNAEHEAFTEVMRYKVGGYFGELSLITNNPRAANVVACGPVKCISLDRESFTRLLGPCEDILKRNKDNYAEIERKIQQAARPGGGGGGGDEKRRS